MIFINSFKYKIILNGKISSGNILCKTREEAMEKILTHNAEIIYLKKSRNLSRKVDIQSLINFCMAIDQYLRGGLTLTDCIGELLQDNSGPFHDILQKIHNDIKNGLLFSEALSYHAHVFDNVFINIIKTGEYVGNLRSGIAELTNYLERVNSVRAKTKEAVRYPIIAGVVMIISMISLGNFLIEPLMDFMSDANMEIPFATKILVVIFFNLQNLAIMIVMIILLILLQKFFLKRYIGFRLFIHKILLSVPYFGDMWKKRDLFYFTYSLQILINNSVQLVDALVVADNIISNTAIKKIVKNLIESIRNGESFGSALQIEISSKSGKLVFSPIMIKSIKIAEDSGFLDETLLQLSNIYFKEFNSSQDLILKLLEPMLLIFLGGILIFLIFGTIMPIYDSINSLPT